MDEENRKIHISDAAASDDFDLEDILAEYRADTDEPQLSDPDMLADISRRLVMDSLEDGIGAAEYDSLHGIVANTVAELMQQNAAALSQTAETLPEAAPQDAEEAPAEAEMPEMPDESNELTAVEEVLIDELTGSYPELETDEVTDDDGSLSYASAEAGSAAPQDGDSEESSETSAKKKSGGRGFLSPVVAILALLTLHRQKRESAGNAAAAKDEKQQETPEMSPDKAVRHYSAHMSSLKSRGRFAVGLSVVMIYLSYAVGSALPLTGALKVSTQVQALLLAIMEISVMMTGLDIFTDGILALVRRKPTAQSLVSASCVLSLIDAGVIAAMQDAGVGLPFCAISAVSMTCAIWGEYFRCLGLRTGFRVLNSSKNHYTVTGEKGIAPGDVALLKARQSTQGFVRRSEAEHYGNTVFRVMTPMLLVAAVVLGILAGIVGKQPKCIFHYISAMAAASCAFSATLCFAAPFAAAAHRFSQSGAAVAGWTGVRDIGRSRHVVITDADVFPKGTVEVANIRILEGCLVDKVLSYTGSVIAASGSGLVAPFSELLRRNGCTLAKLENFEPHDGGGMTAMVNGENVCVGNTGFMNLMGIRVPRKISTKNSVYAAINGSLVGIFTVNYSPVSSVQGALVLLLRGKLEPIFAIRDFNITPQMLRTKFKLPTDNFKFPAYAERYRISGAEPDSNSRVAAVIAREGMGPLVDTAERGRRLFGGIRAGTLIAAAGCVFGLLMMFLLCWTGAFDSTTAGNVITFMLLWMIPTAVIVWDVQR